MKTRRAIGYAAGIVSLLWIQLNPTAGIAADPSFEARKAQMKRDFERKRAQLKADFERRKNAPKATANALSGSSTSFVPEKKKTSTFNAAAAPRPDKCLADLVMTARKATSVTQIMQYFTDEQQEFLKLRQSEYDPKVARERSERMRRENPDYDEETLQFFANSPYQNKLDWYQRVAHKIKKINSVRVDGDKAYLQVEIKSQVVVNGVGYGRGTASITMIGEGNLWRFSTYKEGIMVSR